MLKRTLPISSKYDSPIFESVMLQLIIGVLSLMILDGGDMARVCGIALVAFWGGALVLIWRRPQFPTKTDIELIRYGYLPVVTFAFFLVHLIWRVRGVE